MPPAKKSTESKSGSRKKSARTKNNVNTGDNGPQNHAGQGQSVADHIRTAGRTVGRFVRGATTKGIETAYCVGEDISGAVKKALTGRDKVVMVRISGDTLENIDNLVESGLFKSRSEAAAFLVIRGVEAEKKLFDRIEKKVSQIQKLRDDLKAIVEEEGGIPFADPAE